MLLPFVLGVTVATTAAGLTSYNTLFYGCGIIYIVLLVLVMIFPLPDTDQKAAEKRRTYRQLKAHTFLFRIHRNDPDRIHMYRDFPVMAELCTELCKRERWLG